MICPRCNVEMKPGIAINPERTSEISRSVCSWGIPVFNAETLKLGECLKCPKCGYSDTGKYNNGQVIE